MDKDKVAQVVVAVAAEVRRERTILVDTSLVCMVLLGLLYANRHADNYIEYNGVDSNDIYSSSSKENELKLHKKERNQKYLNDGGP